MKPILFNTEMVQAILDNRKTVTRRLIKPKYSNTHLEMFSNKYGTRLIELQNEVEGETYGKNEDGSTWRKLLAMREIEWDHKPYKVGDILYVRETWCDRWLPDGFLKNENRYGYKSDGAPNYGYWGNDKQSKDNVWIPSIHMPKEAARIFLKVTNIRVERLKNITEDQSVKEGFESGGIKKYWIKATDKFIGLWNSTIKKSDIDLYGWDANPWVWVIEFAKISKENANG